MEIRMWLFYVVESGLGDGWDVAFIYTDNLEFISKADRLINDTRTYWIAGSFYISTYRGVVRVSDYLAFHVDLSRLQDYDGTAGEKQKLQWSCTFDFCW